MPLGEAEERMDKARSKSLYAQVPAGRVASRPRGQLRRRGLTFVPKYALHRPVAGKILRKEYAAAPLHALVERVME